jgi:hypothetical protein
LIYNPDAIIAKVAKSGRGSRPGERRGGRKKGTPNRSTRAIKELAQKHGAEVIEELARIAFNAESEFARVAAIKELLDRGYGKSTQPVAANVLTGPSEDLRRLLEEHDGETSGIQPAIEVCHVQPE